MKENQTICFLRNAALIAIVLHHSMFAFCGLPSNHSIGGTIPPVSNVLSYLCKNFGLGVFTFISGFCLYYQSKKGESFIQFLRKKTNRIIIPCLFFGCVYGLFFRSYMFPAWPAFINGTHLWYLPMLFLCILITSFHFYAKRHVCFLIALCYVGTFLLALRTGCTTFGEFCWYYPIFYVGFLSNKWKLDNLLDKKRMCMIAIGMGGVILWGLQLVHIRWFEWTINMLLISLASYVLFYFLSSHKNIGRIGKSLSKESFSIYLMHQFVINLLLAFVELKTLPYLGALTILFVCSLMIPWLLALTYNHVKAYCKKRNR